MAKHPSKPIDEALKYAERKGWIIKKAGARAHAWGIIHCPHGHQNCRMSIWSTPKNAENHAKAILRKINHCPE